MQSERGDETAYLLGHGILEARAAGLGGTSTAITNLDEVRRVAERSRRFGANGSFAIHPAQIPVLHDVFTPSAEELRAQEAVVVAFAEAAGRGEAVIRHQVRMIDIAHVRSALALFDAVQAWGLDTPAYLQVARSHLATLDEAD